MIIEDDLVFNFDGFVTIVCGRVILQQNFFQTFLRRKRWQSVEKVWATFFVTNIQRFMLAIRRRERRATRKIFLYGLKILARSRTSERERQ